MIVFLQGEFVPEERAVVSVFDRSFRYGDGLFEAVLVRNKRMFRWPQHYQRLARSAHFLGINLPYSALELAAFADELFVRNQQANCLLRLQVSRGVGPRGYAPTGDETSLVVMSLHPTPLREPTLAAWKLTISSFRIAAGDGLAGHKTCSRLLQVCAAREAREREADESLLLNTNGEIVEGSTSNVFWLDGAIVCTPPLTSGALPGVTRAVVLELCDALKIPRTEQSVSADRLCQMNGVFLSLTTRGIVEARSLDNALLRRSPTTIRLRDAYEATLLRECG